MFSMKYHIQPRQVIVPLGDGRQRVFRSLKEFLLCERQVRYGVPPGVRLTGGDEAIAAYVLSKVPDRNRFIHQVNHLIVDESGGQKQFAAVLWDMSRKLISKKYLSMSEKKLQDIEKWYTAPRKWMFWLKSSDRQEIIDVLESVVLQIPNVKVHMNDTNPVLLAYGHKEEWSLHFISIIEDEATKLKLLLPSKTIITEYDYYCRNVADPNGPSHWGYFE